MSGGCLCGHFEHCRTCSPEQYAKDVDVYKAQVEKLLRVAMDGDAASFRRMAMNILEKAGGWQ